MAIASVGTLGRTGSSSANQSSATITTTAALQAGNLGVIAIAVDNAGTSNTDEGAVSGVTDSAGNTWTKAKEHALGSVGAQAGAVCSVWYCRATTQLNLGGTINATFTSTSSRDASAITAWEFTVGGEVTVDATTARVDAGAAPSSLALTTSNVSCLRLRATAMESTNGDMISSASAGWSTISSIASGSGSDSGHQSIDGEFIISTGTTATSNPSWTVTANKDNASVYIAITEVAHVSISPAQSNLAITTSAPELATDALMQPASANLAFDRKLPELVISSATNSQFNPLTQDLVLTSTAPVPSVNSFYNPAVVNLALSTTAPSLQFDTPHAPAAKDFALTAPAPTVAWTDNMWIVPTVGQLVLSNTAPNVSSQADFSLVAGTGSFTVSGEMHTVFSFNLELNHYIELSGFNQREVRMKGVAYNAD